MNDKVKIIWKTNCEWNNKPHWPKRKDIKLPEGQTESPMPLKTGDAVKIKFGGRWYNAEVAEKWEPKGKKGMYFYVSLSNIDHSIEEVVSLETQTSLRKKYPVCTVIMACYVAS